MLLPDQSRESVVVDWGGRRKEDEDGTRLDVGWLAAAARAWAEDDQLTGATPMGWLE